ncbi:MAG: peptidylprolyl isomerase [Ignavibacteriales bacterium]|nr:peptidylprolyl isomerase [Ignavibacteriales bacterium]
MKKIICICLFFIISGCSIFRPEELILIQPKLVEQADLPPLCQPFYTNNLEFYCEMVISCCGKVERAKLLTSSGDSEWDSLAQLSLLKWRYSPAVYNEHPIRITIRRKVKVVFDEPKIYSLAEIQLQNSMQADSVYNALLSGSDFALLALNCSISDSKIRKGNLGNVNIKHFSNEIRTALNNLDEGEFTEPLTYADHYVIYKRLKLNN